MVEFAIALPLLILLMYSLANVSVKIFELDKNQLSDYALETEAQYVMERITHELRAAKEIKIEKFTDKVHKLKIVYHVVEEDDNEGYINFYTSRDKDGAKYYLFEEKDVWETQFFIPRLENGVYVSLNAKRQDDNNLTNPITGDNFFGNTKINILRYSKPDNKDNKVLRIELEMESLETEGKIIKLATAVFMPACKKLEGLDD